MNTRFNADFGDVRIHRDTGAASAAESLDARAFTIANRIAFGPGEYAPESPSGVRLLAHELAHTLQQGAQSSEGTLRVSQPGDALEHEADAIAQSALGGRPLSPPGSAPVHIARAPKPSRLGPAVTQRETHIEPEPEKVPNDPRDIHNQWPSKKETFKRLANDPSNKLNSLQMYTIWTHHWIEEEGTALDDVARIDKGLRSSLGIVAYVQARDLFDIGKRDALGPEYEDAADRRDTAQGVLSAIIDILDWLNVWVDVTGHHVTLDQVNKQANDIARAKWWYQLFMGAIILGAAGAGRGGAGRRPPPRGGISPLERGSSRRSAESARPQQGGAKKLEITPKPAQSRQQEVPKGGAAQEPEAVPSVVPKLTKAARLKEYYQRLQRLVRPKNAEEALQQVRSTLDQVEDELSGIPKKNPPPAPKMPDGRMYPPLDDYVKRHPDGKITARTLGHRIEIDADGRIVFKNLRTGEVEFEKK